MPTPGIVYKDLLPPGHEAVTVPDRTYPDKTYPETTYPERTEQATSMRQNPTASHALAQQALNADVHVQGVAQQYHDEEVVDLGWNEPKELIAAPLVGGVDNEELWKLIRRFNKVY